MLRIVASCVKIFACNLFFFIITQDCYAQESNQENQFIDVGRIAAEKFDSEGVLGRGAKVISRAEDARKIYASVKEGKYGEALGSSSGLLIAGKAADIILKSPAGRSIGKFCASGVLEAGLCVVVIAKLTFDADDVAKKSLGEVGDKVQNSVLPPKNVNQSNLPPDQAIDTNKMRQAQGEWLYIDMAPNGAKLGWGDSNEEHFDGIFMECNKNKKTVYISIDVDSKSGRKSSAKIARGNVILPVQSIVQDGPLNPGVSITVNYLSIFELMSQPGDIVISNSSGSKSYSSKKNGSAIKKFVASCGFKPAQTAQSNGSCLSYQGRVTISGKLERRMFPGPPNYESVARGDSPDPALIMKLDRIACVDRDTSDADGLSPAVASVSEIQIVATAGVVGGDMSGRSAVLSGRLFGAHTGHHRTDVLLNDVQIVSSSPAFNSEMPNSIFVQFCMKDGSGNLKQCSCAGAQFRRGFGPRGFAVIELAIQGKINEAKALFQKMSFNEQFNYGAGTALAANRTNSLCGTRIRM